MAKTDSQTDLIERLATLETRVCLKFEDLDKALVLARQLAEEEKRLTREQTARHFDDVNNFQKRMDRMSDALATKEWVTEKIDALSKLVYIGVGIVLVLEVVFRVIWK
jgi:CHASE3 domain sensor protein